MRKSREQMEQAEAAQLAPYAQLSGASAGRRHPLPRHPYRTEFQRDRARIIHSRAFRRLEYKTQVFLNGTGDHLRTRLTHTIEVASISRTIARALSLNEDLAEAIALAHDLGHAPFGHPGEETLARLMQDHGGFDHNEQSLRIVELIESDYPDVPGLNLSFEVIEGLRKHQLFYEPPPAPGGSLPRERYQSPTLEAQIANLADEITYYSHDLDDGLSSGFISLAQVEGLSVWQGARAEAGARHPGLPEHAAKPAVIRRIIDRQVEDVIATSDARIAAAGVGSVADVRRQPAPLIGYSAELLAANRQLRDFLYPNLYYHPSVRGANDRGCDLLAEVFAEYLAKPEKLGEAAARRLEAEGLHRTVCDYLAGMTDRYLFEEHARLFGDASPAHRSDPAALVR
jgi:dGTPase